MSRTPHRRPPAAGPDPESDLGRDLGLDDKAIPGGQPHIANHPVARHAPLPVVHKPYYAGVMAHGVSAPGEDGSPAWSRHTAPGGKSLADLAREHGMGAGQLVEAARESEDEPGGLARSEVGELARQVAAGTGIPLDPGTAYVVPLHGAGGRITAPAHARPGHAASRGGQPADERRRPEPIPVYVVSEGAGAKPLAICTGRKVNVPASGGDPVRISGRDPRQNGLLVLNESATAMRIADTPGGAATGAILPASMSSYLWLACQGDLWAVADSGSSALVLSVITEFSAAGAG